MLGVYLLSSKVKEAVRRICSDMVSLSRFGTWAHPLVVQVGKRHPLVLSALLPPPAQIGYSDESSNRKKKKKVLNGLVSDSRN
jgi:hypothetical protein